MKATPLLKMSDQEIRFVINSLHLHRDTLAWQEKDIFDLGFSKVVYAKEFAELDSMEMIIISVSLKKLSIEIFKKYGNNSMKKTRQALINLAHVFDLERIQHQMKNNPLDKKKKLTA